MTPIRLAFLLVGLLVSLLQLSCGEESGSASIAELDNESISDSNPKSNLETTSAVAPESPSEPTPAAEPSPTPQQVPPNILIFLIDTQRADFLETYGHEQPTSPNLKAFSEDALVFEKAYAAASSTSPSHASIFTSTYPHTHGVWNRIILPGRENAIYPSLAFGAITLAEVLLDGGYDTAGICGGGNLQNTRGLSQGFEVWDSKFLGAKNRVQRSFQWLSKTRKKDRPFFLFLHTYQVHTPYLPAPEYVKIFADPEYDGPFLKAWQDAYESYSSRPKVPGAIRKIQQDFFNPLLPSDHTEPPPPEDINFLKDLYRAEIRQMDDAFGELVAWLKKEELYDNTLIVVTSDHGEEFWEHGTYGHHQVYDTTMHVPFIVRAPGGPRGEVRKEPIELIDLMPTLVDIAQLPPPPSMVGRVLNWQTPYADAETRPVIGESNWPEHQIAWRVGQRKAMLFPDEDRKAEVYDFAKDSLETKDIATKADGLAFLQEVEAKLSRWMETCLQWRKDFQLQPGNREQDRMSDDALAEMEALGYLDTEREKKGNRIIRPPRKSKKKGGE